MSRQDKATTERNTKTLREFVKRPENKVCADCKRNGELDIDCAIGAYCNDSSQTHDGLLGTCGYSCYYPTIYSADCGILLAAFIYAFAVQASIGAWGHISAK